MEIRGDSVNNENLKFSVPSNVTCTIPSRIHNVTPLPFSLVLAPMSDLDCEMEEGLVDASKVANSLGASG